MNIANLFKVVHEILPTETAIELDNYIVGLENQLDTVTTELELYAKDIENLENQLEELRTNTVKHGEWLEAEDFVYSFWICSNCNFHSQATIANKIYNYCPSCGAKMGG